MSSSELPVVMMMMMTRNELKNNKMSAVVLRIFLRQEYEYFVFDYPIKCNLKLSLPVQGC